MRGILLTKLNFLWSKKLASLLFATFFFNNNFGFLPTHNINQKKIKEAVIVRPSKRLRYLCIHKMAIRR